ncbi:MAG: CbiX/SirB N-terminal domain-containing protein [Actinomycetia bacterium]|nr:CbiX/SirB N-terminal domain-containing protein [Actinomycetes bacterium]
MLAPGSSSPAVTSVAHRLRRELQTLRPEIGVQIAFLDHCPPTVSQVVSQLVSRGHEEVVLVPLRLSQATSDSPDLTGLLQRVQAAHPTATFALAQPVGPAASLLSVVDSRLRSALTQSRTLELDGLVLCTEGAADVRGNALVARRVRQWSSHHKLPCATAVADGSGTSISQAIASLRAQGRRHIAVGAFFLAPDEAYQAQAQMARRFGAVAVADPIGADRELVDLVLARYVVSAMELLHFAEEDQASAVS